MLIFNKLLPVFALPLGWVGLLLLFALVRKKWWPVVLAMIVLFAASLPVVGGRLTGWLEARYPSLKIADAGPADAIVVLGGILGPRVAAGYLTNWDETSERYEGGVALLRAGRAKILVFTGARLPWEKRLRFEGEDLRDIAIAQGVSAEQVLVTREISNTRDEARAIGEMAKERGWKRVIVVTSAWHMPRAALLFRHAGVSIVPFPVDFRSEVGRPLTVMNFLPSAGSLAGTETTLRECYGIAFYAVTGR